MRFLYFSVIKSVAIVLLMMWNACSSERKQRDTRNLSWYQIMIDAKNRDVKIGVNLQYAYLEKVIKSFQQDSLLTRLNIRLTIEKYSELDDISKFDVLLDDLGNMNIFADSNQVITPVFTKIASCENEMKTNIAYKNWLDITRNKFVPFVNTDFEAKFKNDTAKQDKLLPFILAFNELENNDIFRQNPSVDSLRTVMIVERVQNAKIQIESGEVDAADLIFEEKRKLQKPYFPLFLAVHQTSKNKSAALVTIEILISNFRKVTPDYSIINHPEKYPDFHREWYNLLKRE